MKKVLLSVEDNLLRRLDAAADRNGLSRSACVAWLLELRLGHETVRLEFSPVLSVASTLLILLTIVLFALFRLASRRTET